MAPPYYGMIEEVHVMLVDNDNEFVIKMADILTSYDYKVTTVDTPSTAISTLFKEKQKVDVMILNVHSSNLISFDLLAQAVVLDIIAVVICDELNELVAKKTLDAGAYLYLEKPFDEKIMKYLWQFVLRKKIQREKAREELLNGKHKLRNMRGEKNTKNINEGKSQSSANGKIVRRKNCIKWTDDLHAKFMEAIQQLGEGRCFPKKILEVMHVSGLTRMQIASHLQKCRGNNWRSPTERKYMCLPLGQRSSSSFHDSRSSFRKYGTMPQLQTNALNSQRNPDQTQRDPKFSFPTPNTNSIFTRGENSIQQQFYRSQHQTQPYYLNIDNSFNDPFLLAQNNTGDGLQQHETLFEMLGSQNLQGPIIENTNYRSDLTFNNMGHDHTQSDYNLNINAAYGITYPDSTIMSDTNIGAIIEFGATNVNFQSNIDDPNMYDLSNFIATLYESDSEESDADEKEKREAYYNNMDYLL